ncbi:hypothetical protein BCR33DRAFT_459730 [Rhizoclosmatium globosum]|uniref:Uncharacterized protein n=1 Tax=Rhizoclosmatium globosum TaxID=329046 RepID=A0A1Y2CX41_9FUNG|nr:hypothetical protein BCR33DRAFT_459730 [Rhizoclosmatium globosum]|eukprot:ORY51601.1 hypothetical protein BCR33DRAFT_459730 [Rhizoclosmatium globosum]
MYLSSTHQSKILTAILKTNDAAWRITSLMLFFEKLEFNETSRCRIPEAEQVYYCIHRDTLSFFEAFISLWFLTCRMDVQWRSLAGLVMRMCFLLWFGCSLCWRLKRGCRIGLCMHRSWLRCGLW